MPKLVILKFDGGNFQKGFNVTLRIGDEDKPLSTEISGKLPPNPLISENYQRWQSDFLDLDKCQRGRRGDSRIIDPHQIVAQCQQSAKDFINNFKNWLNSPDKALQNLREKLCQQLGDPKQPIRIIIQTDDPWLKKFPWHEWDLFADTYTQAEVALCPTEYEKPNAVQTTDKTAVSILAILGNSEGINIKSDRQSLEKLGSNGAAPTFLVEPKRTEVSDSLWDQNWDILFFAGHSSSQDEKGRIFINRTDSLTIEELKFGLRKAINHGLQLAILNSCDGLKLAEDLADLNIPQVIVMREPVPDRVAQDFLQFFLKAFTGGESLYVAVRHARERLHENGLDDEFPGASWLPVIYQNPTVIPPSWNQLKTPEPEIPKSGNGFRGDNPPKLVTSHQLSRGQEVDIDGSDENEGIMSKLSNVQFLLTHFVPGLIAGVAGLSLAVVLFVYKDILAKDIFPQITQIQATIIIFSIIGLTFFIAIIGIYAWLATKKDIQFKYVIVFMILILTILAFISAGVYIFIPNGELGKEETVDNGENHSLEPEPPSLFYLKAIEALNNDNKSIALDYVNRGLKKIPKNAPEHTSLLALKIKLLLLIGGSDNRTVAKNVADENYGYSSALDGWINCLRKENLFSSIITTETELDQKCLFSNHEVNKNKSFKSSLDDILTSSDWFEERNTISTKHYRKVIPFHTGWIFIGYYSLRKKVFVEGSFAVVAFSPTSEERGAIVPKIGDILEVKKPRQVIIVNYKREGLKNKFSPPVVSHPVSTIRLQTNDETGVILKDKTLVIVRDVEIANYSDRAFAIWCRVAECDYYTDSCKKAYIETKGTGIMLSH